MEISEGLRMYWLPILIGVSLTVSSLYDLYKRENVRVRGRKWAWAVIVLLIGTLGPILYFTLGRKK